MTISANASVLSDPSLRARRRITVAVDVTPLLNPLTGIGVFTREIVNRLSQRDDIALVCFALTWRGRQGLAAVVPPSARVVTRPTAARPLREAWLRVNAPKIERWIGLADVVHGPNFVVPPTRHAAQVVSVHDLTVLHYPQMCTRDTLQYPDLIRRAIRRGAWVHTIAAFKDEIIDVFGVDPLRVVAIDNAATISNAYANDTAGGLTEWGRRLAGTDRFILGVGTIEPRKNFPLLVRAFDQLAAGDPKLRLVIAGPEGWGAKELSGEISRATHKDRITVTGWVADSAREALLRAATLFAYPSSYEGFGLPTLEAMAAGTPVVATNVGGIPHTIGDAAVLVPPDDLAALTAALDTVLTDETQRIALIERGHRNLERFSWDQTVDRLVDLYRRAAAARGFG